MIKKILNKFGYIKKEDLTESEIELMFAETLGDVTEYLIDKKSEIEMFKDLSSVDGYADYLRATAAKDMQRYFGAENEKQRDVVRGAMSRTIYFKTKLKGENKEISSKLEGRRHE